MSARISAETLVDRMPGWAGRIGAAREEITPPAGIYARNWAAAAHEAAEGIHRPLWATALTMQAARDDAPMVLVDLDLGWWRTPEDEWSVRGGLIDALALDPDRVMLALTHTHSGPAICRDDADKPGGTLIGPYLAHVRDAVIRAVRRALDAARDGVLEWAYGRCDLARDRDLPDPGADRIICGYHRTARPDDTLLVGRATGSEGRYIATVVNYACHPVTLAWKNRLISPDFAGALRDTVGRYTESAPCLFLQGASGELAPREQYSSNPRLADRHGRQLGFAALTTLEGMLPPATELRFIGVVESGAPLAKWEPAPRVYSGPARAARATVEYPLKPMPSLAEFDAAIDACDDRVQRERLVRKRRVRSAVGDGESAEIPLWVWRLGDAYLVGHPNEAYNVLQIELRSRFPGRAIVVMNVVNGHIGYLPPRDRYAHDLYPVWQTAFDAGSLERFIEACAAVIGMMENPPVE